MISRIITRLMPIVPKRIVERVARRYIAGETTKEAVHTALRLKDKGFFSTIDFLGEDIDSILQANTVVESYINLMGDIEKAGVSRNVSLKLSSLGLRINQVWAFKKLSILINEASKRNFFIRLDMEDSLLTDSTIDFFQRAVAIWPKIGTVLQARLKRTRKDAGSLSGPDKNFRLCKGIYPESEKNAFMNDKDIRESFLDSFHTLMDSGSYVGIATHDLSLITRIENEIEMRSIPKNRFEFQVLLGVPVQSTINRLRDKGYKVRIYLPYGKEWYAYSIRRLRENPGITRAVLKGLFNRDYESLTKAKQSRL